MLRSAALGLLAAGLSISSAHAVEPYIALDVGANIPGDIDTSAPGLPDFQFEGDPGLFIGGRVGLDLLLIFRAEGEISWRRSEVDLGGLGQIGGFDGLTTDDDALGFFGNGYVDIPTPGIPLDPYIGFGVGAIRFGDAEETQAAWQGIAGAAIPFSKRLNLDLTYRFSRTFDGRFDDLANNFTGHAVTAGLRFEFAVTD